MNDNTNNTTTQPTTNPQVTGSTIVTAAQLNSIGIVLPANQMEALIQHTEDSINELIGEEIVASLDEDQLKQLLDMQEANAPADQLEQWMADRVPEYKEIVEDNVAIVLGDLARSADAITEAQ